MFVFQLIVERFYPMFKQTREMVYTQYLTNTTATCFMYNYLRFNKNLNINILKVEIVFEAIMERSKNTSFAYIICYYNLLKIRLKVELYKSLYVSEKYDVDKFFQHVFLQDEGSYSESRKAAH